MKKSLQKISITLFLMILIIPTIIWCGIKMVGSDEMIEGLEYDLGENRNMTSFSIDNMEDYYNDHVPFRSSIISLHTKLDSMIEKNYRANIQGALAKTFYPNLKTGNTVSLADLLDSAQEMTNVSEKTDTISEEKTECNYEAIEEVAATCTDDGYVVKKCKDCNEEIKEVLQATGHDEEILETLEPTYLNYGHTIYRCTVCGDKRWADFQEKLIDDSYLPCVIENNMTVLGRFSWLFYRGNASLNYYRGVNILSNEDKQSYLNSMQELQDICDAKNKKLIFAIFPNKEQVYPEYMPSLEIVNEIKREPDFVEYVTTNSNINIIYPINELMLGKLYYDTYYPYDSHWNNLGAFIGAQEILKALDMETTDFVTLKTTLTAETERGLIATGALNESDYTGDFDYVLSYKEDVNILSEETTSNYKQVITSDSSNKEKIMIVGDSFRLRTIQYFKKDFSKVTAIHRDDIYQAKDELKEADVLLVCCVERFDSEMIKNIAALVSILK